MAYAARQLPAARSPSIPRSHPTTEFQLTTLGDASSRHRRATLRLHRAPSLGCVGRVDPDDRGESGLVSGGRSLESYQAAPKLNPTLKEASEALKRVP